MDGLYALPIDPEVPPPPASVENFLRLDAIPFGRSRLFIELIGDGLATGVRVPIVVAKGAEPGPVLGLTACVHGNELNGIPVIHDVFMRTNCEALRGTVVGVVAVNVPGLHAARRQFIDGTDLNRIMPGRAEGSVAEVYAYRILERILAPLDYLIDLHTASFGRLNSLYVRADMTNEVTARMAYLQRPQIIVHNPPSDHTLRGAMMARGVPSITVEIGDPQIWQEEYTIRATAGVKRVMTHLGMMAEDDKPQDGDVVLCRKSGWMYTDRGGLLQVHPGVAERIEKGQRVATLRNAFGDVFREYCAPTSGVVVGKSVNPISQTGARILHLGEIADDSDPFLRFE